MYRRPARDRNYEFWGDQTFFGENPPQAARHLVVQQEAGRRREAEDHRCGRPRGPRDLRAGAGEQQQGRDPVGVLGSARAAGAGAAAGGRRRGRRGRQSGRPRRRPRPATSTAPDDRSKDGGGRPDAGSSQEQSPFGAGCGAPAGRAVAAGSAAPAVNSPDRSCIGGIYNVSLIVDGKTVDTKPLRVIDDPEVVLTSVERKRMFDMAMEMHALQPRVTEASRGARVADPSDLTELATTIGGPERHSGRREGVVRRVQQGARGARAEADRRRRAAAAAAVAAAAGRPRAWSSRSVRRRTA